MARLARSCRGKRSVNRSRWRRNPIMSKSAGTTWQHFDFALKDGVATITLNRPAKLNALTFEAYADLPDLFTQVARDGAAKVVVLRGEGQAFCSGGDVEEIIGELQKFDVDELLEF